MRVIWQFGFALPLFETKPGFDEDISPSKHIPAWLDDNWYRRLAMPSVVPWESEGGDS